MITDREYKALLEQYGFEVEHGYGYIKNDEYIGESGDWTRIFEWYYEGDILIYEPKIKK